VSGDNNMGCMGLESRLGIPENAACCVPQAVCARSRGPGQRLGSGTLWWQEIVPCRCAHAGLGCCCQVQGGTQEGVVLVQKAVAVVVGMVLQVLWLASLQYPCLMADGDAGGAAHVPGRSELPGVCEAAVGCQPSYKGSHTPHMQRLTPADAQNRDQPCQVSAAASSAAGVLQVPTGVACWWSAATVQGLGIYQPARLIVSRGHVVWACWLCAARAMLCAVAPCGKQYGHVHTAPWLWWVCHAVRFSQALQLGGVAHQALTCLGVGIVAGGSDEAFRRSGGVTGVCP
jgi:hypothetical protein